MNIKELIGETIEYDKKVSVEKNKIRSWLKSICAFANGVGGALIFGIDDNDNVIGLDDIKDDSEFVSQKIKDYIDPIPQTIMHIQKENNKDILIIEVLSGEETPYYFIQRGKMETFIRIGNESVIANATEQKRLILRGKNTSFDALITDYKFEDYSFSKLKERYKQYTGNSFEDKMYISFGITNNKGYLTNAGALLADESPIYQSRVFCTRWNGLNKSGGIIDALDSGEYNGSIISLLNDSVSFINRNNKIMWKKTNNSRIEMPDYVERSYMEILVNALIHRNYLIVGSEIHVDIFDDRIVVYSPGGMPDGRIIQNIDIHNIPSTRRNPILADIFHRLGYMERQGSGLEKIINSYKQSPNYTIDKYPTFYSDQIQFTVTLMNLNYDKNDNNKRINNNLKNSIKNIIINNPTISQRNLALELNISFRKVQHLMKEMKEEEILERIGGNRNGYWIIK